jgi:hypothetical protein
MAVAEVISQSNIMFHSPRRVTRMDGSRLTAAAFVVEEEEEAIDAPCSVFSWA